MTLLKNRGHRARLGESNRLFIWRNYPQRNLLGLDCAHGRARANDALKIMRST